MITDAEFRIMRDRFALDGYYQRWPRLWRDKHALWEQIKTVNVQLAVKVTPHLEEEKTALWWKFQDVAGELSALKQDAKVRYERLHAPKPDIVSESIAAWDSLLSVFGAKRKMADA